MFVEQIVSDPISYFSWILAAGFSICCHEFAHAWTAVFFGDETPRNHLTLDPRIQMGTQSMFMLCLIGIAWGAVPVNPDAVRENWKRSLISFAGPLMNVFLCIVFSLFGAIFETFGLSETSQEFFFSAGYVNGALFILNMLPVPTLDGYSVVSAFSPKLEEIKRKYASRIFIFFALIIFVTPVGQYIFYGGAIMTVIFKSLFSNVLMMIGLG